MKYIKFILRGLPRARNLGVSKGERHALPFGRPSRFHTALDEIKWITVVMTALVLLAAINQAVAAEQPLDRIAAIVNDEVITVHTLNQSVHRIKARFSSEHTAHVPPDAVLRTQLLDQLINRRLQLQLAHQNGVHVNTEDINTAISALAKDNHATVSNFYKQMVRHGYSRKSFRQEIQDELMIQKIQAQAVTSRIAVSEEDVQRFMQQDAWKKQDPRSFHIKDILIPLPTNPSPTDIARTKKKATQLLRQIRRTNTFPNVSTHVPGEKLWTGSDLGWRTQTALPRVFSERVTHMKKGEIAGPIRAPNGFHLIQLAGIKHPKGKTALPRTAKEQKALARNLVFQQKYRVALQDWLREIRDAAYVKRLLNDS